MGQDLQTITLGGGCFWCTDAVFARVKGVLSVESGYCNGHVLQPGYDAVCSGQTGHAEVVKLVFDPTFVSLRELLEVFFVIHDPTTLNAQGHDHGTQYRSGIFVDNPAQAQVAHGVIAELTQSNAFAKPIVTEVTPLANYWPAEAFHQNFFANHPHQGYCRAVAAPKVAKFQKTFANLVKG